MARPDAATGGAIDRLTVSRATGAVHAGPEPEQVDRP